MAHISAFRLVKSFLLAKEAHFEMSACAELLLPMPELNQVLVRFSFIWLSLTRCVVFGLVRMSLSQLKAWLQHLVFHLGSLCKRWVLCPWPLKNIIVLCLVILLHSVLPDFYIGHTVDFLERPVPLVALLAVLADCCRVRGSNRWLAL